MALLLTLDASVFVAACRRSEAGHASSRALLDSLAGTDVPLIEPALLPVEVAATLSRTGVDAALAQDFAEAILDLPHLTVVAVDERLIRRAITAATQHKLRGSDALYITVAAQYGARLVTLDEQDALHPLGAFPEI